MWPSLPCSHALWDDRTVACVRQDGRPSLAYHWDILLGGMGHAGLKRVCLCSNQDAILGKGGGDAGASWGPFVQNVGSFFTDAAGQERLDTVWTDIKVCRMCIVTV